MYDLIILGAGPAGMTAAIYAGRAALKFTIIEANPFCGGQVTNSGTIDNYPGMPFIDGFELSQAFYEHSKKFTDNYIFKTIKNIDLKNKTITFSDDSTITSKTILIALGQETRKLGINGENKKGVSYCATCDGNFFKDKTVCVVGGGDTAFDDVLYLSKIAKKVYLIHRREEFRGSTLYLNKIKELPNTEIITNTVIDEICGENFVEYIKIKNVLTNDISTLNIDGVFVAIGSIPRTKELNELNLDENGYIIANEDCKTNLDGIFVAGDIRTKQLRQIVTAVSDGATSIDSIGKYLNE